jgi:hypothetical protein
MQKWDWAESSRHGRLWICQLSKHRLSNDVGMVNQIRSIKFRAFVSTTNLFSPCDIARSDLLMNRRSKMQAPSGAKALAEKKGLIAALKALRHPKAIFQQTVKPVCI